MILNRKEIELILPHRSPFLFLDKCEVIEKGIKGIGYRKFLPNEFFFSGHFPGKPIVPGVILVEALAQTSGIVVAVGFENQKEKSVLFMSISKAKFRKPVFPNEEITLEVNYANKVQSVYKFNGNAFNKKDQKVCEAEFSAMITDKVGEEIF